MIIAVIAVKEEIKVETVDNPGAYLQTYLRDATVIVRFVGRMAELLEIIYLKTYRSYLKLTTESRYYTPKWQRYSTAYSGTHYCFVSRYQRRKCSGSSSLSHTTGV